MTDPALEAGYREHDRQFRLRYSRAACVLIAVLVPFGVSLDYFVYPDRMGEFLIARLVVSVIALLVLALHETSFGQRQVKLLGILPPLVTNAAISWMIYRTEGAASPYYAGLNLVLFGIAVLLPWTFGETLLVSALTMLFYLVASFTNTTTEFEGSIFFNNIYFLLIASIICCTSGFMKTRARKAEFELQAQVNRSHAQLTHMERLKTQFFANVSHELRTPLTLIVSPLEDALKESPNDVTLRNLLQVAHKNSLRLLKLINELLEFVRLDTTKTTRQKQPVQLGEFVAAQVESVRPLARMQNLELELRLGDAPLWVSANGEHLERILVNLLTNAIKYTEPGGRVTVTARVEPDYGVVDVRDTGVGIAEEDIQLIFDRFRQAESSRQMNARGMGIGLALAKELTEENDGRLSAKSSPGVGTTMTLHLPRIPPPEQGVVPQTPATDPISLAASKADLDVPGPRPRAPSPLPLESGSDRPTVLVVDDEEDMRSYVASTLARRYSVVEATNGHEALDMVDEAAPSLVVLDVMMPVMDGTEVCRRLADRPNRERPRILMLTARSDQETKLDALEQGADDFLTKPFGSSELLLRVDNLMRARTLEENLHERNARLDKALKAIKEAEVKLVSSEKFAALGRMAGGLLHELNNPLNYALTATSLARERAKRLPKQQGTTSFEEILDDVHEGLQRVGDVISTMRSFSNPGALNRSERLLLGRVVARAVSQARPGLNGIELSVNVANDLEVVGTEVELEHVFSNLIRNAADAIKESGIGDNIDVKATRVDTRITVEVSDNGPGMAPDVADKALEPFVTTKAPGQGMGLGLAICDRFVRNHGGFIIVRSQPNSGTSVVFDLPSTGEPKEP